MSENTYPALTLEAGAKPRRELPRQATAGLTWNGRHGAAGGDAATPNSGSSERLSPARGIRNALLASVVLWAFVASGLYFMLR